MTKFTKGKWSITTASDGSMAIDPEVGFCITPIQVREGMEQDLPNFMLMATAPELYEACDDCDTAFAVLNIGSEEAMTPQACRAMRDAWAKVNAAMAKATGTADKFKEANPVRTFELSGEEFLTKQGRIECEGGVCRYVGKNYKGGVLGILQDALENVKDENWIETTGKDYSKE